MNKIRHFETDDDMYQLAKWCHENTPLRQVSIDATCTAFKALFRLGYRLVEPDHHPSGLQTLERAITKVDRCRPSFIDGTPKVEG